jgi:hypothetical protein
VPKSKVRKKDDYIPARGGLTAPASKALAPSPPWYPIAMCAVLIIGLAYIVVYYMAGERVPVMQDLAGWNFAISFGLMIIGLGMAVRWR